MQPEFWSWQNIWLGYPERPVHVDAYKACRFLHALETIPIERLIKSITQPKTLIMAFRIVKWLYGNEEACAIADRCKITNFKIIRILTL